MGYSSETILMYGVTLNQDQMKVLMAALRKQGDDLAELGLVPAADVELVPMGYKDYTFKVYDAEIRSQDSDSRCDSCHYDGENIFEHVFGINCGHGEVFKKQGVKMVDVIRDIPIKAIGNFNHYCLPVLIEAGIEINPDMILVNQVW
jgi:hypothetical protein